ncbi:MAG TPA: hypothetical protein VGW34_14175 [Allosphingosinicella sp.]|nr:hypothetical protein [Allosphingosinicella sp.]
MAIETRPSDAADYLDARGDIARRGEEAGLGRQALHKASSEDGNPTLDTVLKALGLHMRIAEVGPAEREMERA